MCQQPVPAALSLADAVALAPPAQPSYRQTIHDRSRRRPWGRVLMPGRCLWPPADLAPGGVVTSGPGEQNFLTSSFSQSVSTWSSNYSFLLDWTLNGQTLSQPRLKEGAAERGGRGRRRRGDQSGDRVTAAVPTVLQARDNAEVARQQLDHDEQFRSWRRRATEVGVLADRRAAGAGGPRTAEWCCSGHAPRSRSRSCGCSADRRVGAGGPGDGAALPTRSASDPDLALEPTCWDGRAAEPSLKALRERERAAGWGVKAASSKAGVPSVSLSAGWSGSTQKLSDVNPTIGAIRASAQTDSLACAYENAAMVELGTDPAQLRGPHKHGCPGTGLPRPEQPLSIPFHAAAVPGAAHRHDPAVAELPAAAASVAGQGAASRIAGIGARARPPGADRRQPGVPYAGDGVSDDCHSGYEPYRGTRAAAARHGAVPRRLGDVLRAARRQVAGLRAETDYINAVYDYHKALAALEAASAGRCGNRRIRTAMSKRSKVLVGAGAAVLIIAIVVISGRRAAGPRPGSAVRDGGPARPRRRRDGERQDPAQEEGRRLGRHHGTHHADRGAPKATW